jgi:hypothetical protein
MGLPSNRGVVKEAVEVMERTRRARTTAEAQLLDRSMRFSGADLLERVIAGTAPRGQFSIGGLQVRVR